MNTVILNAAYVLPLMGLRFEPYPDDHLQLLNRRALRRIMYDERGDFVFPLLEPYASEKDDTK